MIIQYLLGKESDTKKQPKKRKQEGKEKKENLPDVFSDREWNMALKVLNPDSKWENFLSGQVSKAEHIVWIMEYAVTIQTLYPDSVCFLNSKQRGFIFISIIISV